MTIQQVILSNKPFRRKSWMDNSSFYKFDYDLKYILLTPNGTELPLFMIPSKTDILANDWIIQNISKKKSKCKKKEKRNKK